MIQSILFFGAILFVALDALDTYMIVHHGGREINKLGMKQMIQKMGLIPALICSHGALIGLLFYWRASFPEWFLAAFLFAFVVIFYHNIISWIHAGHGL